MDCLVRVTHLPHVTIAVVFVYGEAGCASCNFEPSLWWCLCAPTEPAAVKTADRSTLSCTEVSHP